MKNAYFVPDQKAVIGPKFEEWMRTGNHSQFMLADSYEESRLKVGDIVTYKHTYQGDNTEFSGKPDANLLIVYVRHDPVGRTWYVPALALLTVEEAAEIGLYTETLA